jgi:Rieske Fe-S protein
VLWEEREEALVCPCHDGRFSAVTGEVLAGPPPRPLPRIDLEERDDGIYAVGARVR